MGNLTEARKDRDVRAELKPGGRTCQCAECGLFFTGVAPFDRHMNRDNDENWLGCKTVVEMEAIGMRTNKHGVWQYGLSLREVAEQQVKQEAFA